MESTDLPRLIAEILLPILPTIIKAGGMIGDKAKEEIFKEVGGEAGKWAISMWQKIFTKAGEEKKNIQSRIEQVDENDRKEELGKIIAEMMGEDQAFTKEIKTSYKNYTKNTSKYHLQSSQGGFIIVDSSVIFYGLAPWQSPQIGNTLISKVDALPAPANQIPEALKGKSGAEIPVGVTLFRQLLEDNYRALHLNLPWNVLPEQPAVQPEFYDRRVLMQDIRSRKNSVRIFELNGPSGIGKKHVLCALKNDKDKERNGISDELWGNWLYPFADGSQQTTYEQIIREFSACLGNTHLKDPLAALASCLEMKASEAKPGERVNVLFLLDNADHLAPEVLAKLAGNEGPVGGVIRRYFPRGEQNYFLRLVITSRRPCLTDSFRAEHKLTHIRNHSLEPLDIETVGEMVYRAANIKDIDQQWIDSVSKYIVQICGGHPGAIYQIIEQLKSRHFAIPPDSLIAEYRPLVLQMIQRDIIGELSLKEYLLLNVLSVFHTFNWNMIDELIKRGLLPQDVLPQIGASPSKKEVLITRWLNQLGEATGLIYFCQKGPYQLYQVHPVLQSILLMDLEIRNPLMLQILCQEVQKIYHDWLTATNEGDSLPKMDLVPWVVAALASIYHMAYANYVLTPEQRNCQELLELAENYSQLYRGMIELRGGDLFAGSNLLYNQWKEDTELQELIRNLDCENDLNAQFEDLFNIL